MLTLKNIAGQSAIKSGFSAKKRTFVCKSCKSVKPSKNTDYCTCGKPKESFRKKSRRENAEE